jgi:hypothetical protein
LLACWKEVFVVAQPAPSAAAVSRAARGLRDVLASFDPALLTGDECAAVVRDLAVVGKAASAAMARAAARAGECGAHEAEGFADAPDWLARHLGSSTGKARSDLNTIGDLGQCPRASEELAAGRLSLEQAKEITTTEKQRPGSEAELLEVAQRSGLAKLRERARKRRLEAIPA